MKARIAVALACLLLSGCGLHWPTWIVGWPPTTGTSIGEPTPPAVVPPMPTPVPSPAPIVSPEPPIVPKRPPSVPLAEKVENGDRVKRISAARGDLKTGLTQLELRAVTACTEPGEACVDNQALIDRARALDARLAAALVDPKASVDWAEVQTVLRAVVDTAMKGAK